MQAGILMWQALEKENIFSQLQLLVYIINRLYISIEIIFLFFEYIIYIFMIHDACMDSMKCGNGFCILGNMLHATSLSHGSGSRPYKRGIHPLLRMMFHVTNTHKTTLW